MKITGQNFIDIIVADMKANGDGDKLEDTYILNRIRDLSEFDLRSIITFGKK